MLVAVGLLLTSGLGALATTRKPKLSTGIGVGGAVAGCVIGLCGAIPALLDGTTTVYSVPWSVPSASFSLTLDPLAAFFLIPILLLSAVAAPYGAEYLLAGAKHRSRQGASVGSSWFFYALLVAGMVLVVTASNAVLFLIAWEVMSLVSYFLVTFDHQKPSVRRAGWTYLVATHIATSALLIMFLLLGSNGSLDFDQFVSNHNGPIIFILAIIGFGTKAGFIPFHVWLPQAHPVAPSHVSAVMSGVMIKTGIYGILRTLTFFDAPPIWFGWVLLGIGISSGILGVLLAIAQHDLKRLLAYHSVENIGIIAMGLGIGLLGISTGHPVLATLGFAGGLLHVFNHAMFKGLLFLSAGSALHATGTLEIDRLGGLMKKMPLTAIAFLFGAIAISALVPLNGFISEFLIYLGALRTPGVWAPLVIGSLALIGGLAVLCFTKAFGTVFLGSPRTELATEPHDPGLLMLIPMALLMLGCLAVGFFPAVFLRTLTPVIEQLAATGVQETLGVTSTTLSSIVIASSALIALILLLVGLRWRLLAHRQVAREPTWGCGYGAPTPRMQYTASSFAQPVTTLFQPVLQTRHHVVEPKGIFPQEASLETHIPDVFIEWLFRPIFIIVVALFAYLHWLQNGRIRLYVLYILITLIALFVWGFA